ncbi:hypothetical protein FPV67DRAFT_1464451 [Lyophyllum atratum]|nr:hypothetical protein FPV67DRAFT_1464451 [Lyophyllum atratum]
MASSSSSASQRRRPPRKRQPLSRSNSSFLGTIKNLVTAPLAWFASTDDFEDSKDLKGKRRRLAGAPTEPSIEDDDRLTRTKRMRLHSPTRDESLSQLPSSAAHHGYLDPPGAVFQQQQHRPHSPFDQPPSTRSASITRQYDFSNNNSNYIRASTLSRTMSIDPPNRPLSRASAMASVPLNRDTSMDSSSFIRTVPRDMSMPPLSARPSFRMRTSMTPQPPPPREVSEPPPLHSLGSNPTFIRAPQMKPSESMQGGLSRQSSVTLGSLVDSVRTNRSPVRQHSSLLFGTKDERASQSPRPESAIEKALHELDIYKTPLVPTRLRSSNIPATSSSADLFKSRRSSHLILMQDEKRINRLGRDVSGKKEVPVVNGTKPYAGEGGMKKLLARRKQEADEENDDGQPSIQDEGEDRMDEGVQKLGKRVATRVEISPPVLPPTKTDWFSANTISSSRPAATSSLRVGRTKARNHIARPPRPAKTKFSAAYDDDDAMDDAEELDPEAIERKKEREALEEAAKRAPVFQIPAGFSFAKEIKPIEDDSRNAKEPPIMSLPFSFAKPASVLANLPSQPSTTSSSGLQSSTTSIFGTNLQPASAAAPALSLSPAPPQKPPSPLPQVQSTGVAASAITNTGVPNFFANSSALAKPLDLPKSAPLIFTPQNAAPATAGSLTLVTPVKDADNPLWEGESKKDTVTQASGSTLFAGLGGTASGGAPSASSRSSVFDISSTSTSTAGPAPSIPAFGGAAKQNDAAPPPSQPSFFGGPPATMPTFSFSGPVEPTSSTLFGGDLLKASSPFGEPSTSATSLPSLDAPKLPVLSGEPSKAVNIAPGSAFGSTESKPTGLFGGPPNTATSATGLFSFGQPSTSASSAPFSEVVHFLLPFSFGAAPSTPPPVDVKKSTAFNFGSPATTVPVPAPASVGFSFSGGGSNASDVSSKPFAFGQPAAMTTTVRPSTPPRNQEQEVSMEESPTRDTQQMDKPIDRPILGGGGFSFPATAPGSTFGTQRNESSTSFSFGTQSSSTNPFVKDNKAIENTSFGGFGQAAASSTTFGFGQNKSSDIEPPRPSTTGSFAFGASPSSATGPAPAFAFGGPGNNSTGGLFGQPQASGSAPGSPSTFSQPSPFAFGAPLPPVNTSFAFGSQPASPAGGNNLSLPQPATPGGFGNTGAGFGQPQPSSPFGAPATAAPTAAAGALFTMGSAAPPPAGGARQIRKLPNRRAGAKR